MSEIIYKHLPNSILILLEKKSKYEKKRDFLLKEVSSLDNGFKPLCLNQESVFGLDELNRLLLESNKKLILPENIKIKIDKIAKLIREEEYNEINKRKKINKKIKIINDMIQSIFYHIYHIVNESFNTLEYNLSQYSISLDKLGGFKIELMNMLDENKIEYVTTDSIYDSQLIMYPFKFRQYKRNGIVIHNADFRDFIDHTLNTKLKEYISKERSSIMDYDIMNILYKIKQVKSS